MGVLAGLSWSVDEKSLNDAFSSFGQVTEGRQIPKDLNNGLNYSIRSVQKQGIFMLHYIFLIKCPDELDQFFASNLLEIKL